jgi:hypothetical protein
MVSSMQELLAFMSGCRKNWHDVAMFSKYIFNWGMCWFPCNIIKWVTWVTFAKPLFRSVDGPTMSELTHTWKDCFNIIGSCGNS